MIRIPKRSGFVLLEVVISLTILAITVSAILRSFSLSLNAIRQLEVRTQASFLAQKLIETIELNPPEPGDGSIPLDPSPDFPGYIPGAYVTEELPKYGNKMHHMDRDDLVPLRLLSLWIDYDNGRNKPFRAIQIETAIVGFERFSDQAKISMNDF